MDNDGQWGSVYPFTITINQVKKFYYVKDHLGNIRQTLNETGGIASAQDYYPYGEVLRGYNQSLVNEKYKFTEKERDAETNFDYFGGRFYDGALPMWLQADPLGDNYPGLSPYTYCFNNPLRYVDPNGQSGWDIIKGGLAAVIDNFSFGSSNLREQGGQNASSASDYNLGQDIGDAISATAGVIEIIAGAVSEGGGVIVTAGTGGAGAVVGAPAVAAGVVVQAHGAATATYSANNFFSQKGREGGVEGERNWKQDQKLTKGETDALEAAGVDIHDMKKKNGEGKADLYKDKDGNIYIKPKGGKGPGEPTDYNIKDIMKE